MGKIESMIKAEIQRLARREIRSTFFPLKREVWAMRLRLSNLFKGFRALDRMAKEQLVQKASEQFKLEAPPEEIKVARLSPARIRALRMKKGLSQRKLAMLLGVSLGTVLLWEKGKFKPKGDKKGALIALRRMRKRDIKKILAEKKESEPKPKEKAVKGNFKKASRRKSKRAKKVGG